MSVIDSAAAVGWRRGHPRPRPERTSGASPDDRCRVGDECPAGSEPHAETLRSVGLKPTHGRIRVLALAGQVGVMTPEMAIHRLPDVGLGSVYRILSELCAAGLLVRCTVCLGRQAYAVAGALLRIVLHCLQCGQTQGVDASDIVVQFEQIAAREGYLFDRAVLGTSTCARCAAQAPGAPRTPSTRAPLP